MKELTKAEEQVMQNLWKLKKAFLKDIVDAFEEPRPVYSTVQTMVRILVKKGFIGFKTYGKTNEYFPLVKKDVYFRSHLKMEIKNFFSGSLSKFALFFANDKDLKISELEEIKKAIESKISKLKENNE
jgi:predicted transcriptional regulator